MSVDTYSHSWYIAFSKLTLKIQAQGHGWGESSKSQSGSDRLPVNSYPFRSKPIGHPIPGILLFQNLTMKIQSQGHNSRSQSGSNILSTRSLLFYVNWPRIPDIKLFQNLTLKMPRQGNGWGQSSKSQSGSDFQATQIPFLSNRTSHSWDAFFSLKLTLKIQDQGHNSRSQSGSNILSTQSILFYVNWPHI